MSEADAIALDVQHLVAGYGEQKVLDDIAFAVQRGEIVVVLGGSGSGKSTLLRCIVGLLKPWNGTVLIAGKDVNAAEGEAREEILRNVGMSFQSAALLNSMTVIDNVALPIIEHLHVDARTAAMLARMRLARVGLANAGDKMPSELSGGMRKRAGLARAMALDPRLLLFDEPSAGLDPITGRELDELILDLKREDAMGIVVVTHELGSINTIADRAIMLADGKVLAAGTLDEVRRNADARVQAFFKRQTLGDHKDNELVGVLEGPA
jgi:phospholipid/cholesterol/gamma-HCH transport system ATP-binding protein